MNRSWKGLYSYGAVGVELNASVLLGFFGGRWLDGKWETSPWFTLILTSAGFVLGVYALHRIGKRANEEDEEDPQQSPPAPDETISEDDDG